jgi:NADH:ubiquinone oxidoreductase subunit E
MDFGIVDEIINKYKDPSGRILGILEDIQDVYNYLPKEVMFYVSRKLNVPLSSLYSVATFYSFFNLEPVGEHLISVCMGTACHVKGAPELLENLKHLLGIDVNEVTDDGKFVLTTTDGKFSLSSARCFGCCSMAPVIRIDDKIYGYVKIKDLPAILKEYGWKEK